MADDTGASAVWVAQKVPDDHITAVANQFVIGQIDLKDPVNFMASGKFKLMSMLQIFFVFYGLYFVVCACFSALFFACCVLYSVF